ncbi:MAG TPA: hypothetical protein VHI52_07540 [Verrucomicrobiae bacterium]|nr:hypothetical protein [Verrucomicrobiae bacterium]
MTGPTRLPQRTRRSRWFAMLYVSGGGPLASVVRIEVFVCVLLV